MSDFTADQTAFLEDFERKVIQGETGQYLDLVRNCKNKFQFAKTYRVYRQDLERTEAQMRGRIARGDLGPGITPEVANEMMRIGREAVETKMERCALYFQTTWGEPITNYAGTGKGCMGMVVLFVLASAVFVAISA